VGILLEAGDRYNQGKTKNFQKDRHPAYKIGKAKENRQNGYGRQGMPGNYAASHPLYNDTGSADLIRTCRRNKSASFNSSGNALIYYRQSNFTWTHGHHEKIASQTSQRTPAQ